MEFLLTLIGEEQRSLLEMTEELCRGRLGELERKVGETNVVSREILGCLADAGLLDWTVPSKYATDSGSSPCARSDVPRFLLFGTGDPGSPLPERRVDFHHAGAWLGADFFFRQRGAASKLPSPSRIR